MKPKVEHGYGCSNTRHFTRTAVSLMYLDSGFQSMDTNTDYESLNLRIM